MYPFSNSWTDDRSLGVYVHEKSGDISFNLICIQLNNGAAVRRVPAKQKRQLCLPAFSLHIAVKGESPGKQDRAERAEVVVEHDGSAGNILSWQHNEIRADRIWHCKICKLNERVLSFFPLRDGSLVHQPVGPLPTVHPLQAATNFM